MTDPTPDDLDRLLAPQPGGPRPGLRESVLRETERILWRGRWLRRAAKAGAVAAVFAIGGVVGWQARPERIVVETVTLPAEVISIPVIVPVEVPVPIESPVPAPQAAVAAVVPMSASAAELLAEQADAPGEATRLYRHAGDLYLNDIQDYRNAARCYRIFLDRAGEAGLKTDPADTWLLTSLKNKAFQEKFHVAKTDG